MTVDTQRIRAEVLADSEHLFGSKFLCCPGHRIVVDHVIDLVEEVEQRREAITNLTEENRSMTDTPIVALSPIDIDDDSKPYIADSSNTCPRCHDRIAPDGMARHLNVCEGN